MSKIKIKAAIFDFDGTLVDSESLYTKSLIYMADKMKVLKDVDFKSMAGYQTDDIKKMLIEKNYYIPENFFEDTEKYFRQIIETDLETFDNVIETLEKMKKLDMVIASNSNISYVKRMSEKKGISQYIKDYSCHNEQLKAKPEPDLFLYAFELLKKYNNSITKEDALIFEDSLAGVEGAKKTGIKIAAITNSYDEETLKEKGADIVINNIVEIFNYIELC